MHVGQDAVMRNYVNDLTIGRTQAQRPGAQALVCIPLFNINQVGVYYVFIFVCCTLLNILGVQSSPKHRPD